MYTDGAKHQWIEMLLSTFDLGLRHAFNVDRLIDQAEAGEWSGLWW